MICRTSLALSAATALMLFACGCTQPTPPAADGEGAEGAAAAAAPAGDQAQVEQLVLVNRMLASREMAVLGAYGHASVRSATNPERYFIARAVSPGLVSAGDIYESDLDNRPVSGETKALLDDRFLHGEIYRARPDVTAIVYSKAPSIVAFSVSSVPLPTNPLVPESRPVPVFDIRRAPGGEVGAINSPALGSAMAGTLGKSTTLLLFGNGAVIASGSAGSVVNAALDLRMTADDRLFQVAVGGTPNRMVYTRKQAIPEAGGAEDTGPSGRVERINRFAAYFNHLGARDLARVSRATEPHTRDPNSDQALIQDLVIANRLMASDDIGVLTPDGLAHVSVRSRANPNHYFIAHDVSPGMVTAADIIENDLDSVPVREDQRALPQYSERYIHGEIYKTRPDITAILHAHTPELVTFGKSSATLRPVLNTALFIGNGLPIYDLTKFTGGAPSPVSCAHCISTPQLARALAQLMGGKDASLLLDHGIAVGAPSLRALVSRAYNFRMNAKIQALAIGLGGTVGGFEKNVASNAAADSYPEWDYWQQQVLGSAAAIDPTVAYTPPSGLPTRRQ
jgi:HCOMODA/2-hydroxy-3-carboxy-muconic semialdehyde decarboxylase